MSANLNSSSSSFSRFVEPLCEGELRERISAAYRVPEPDCVPPLVAQATLSPEAEARVFATTVDLVGKMRAKTSGSVAALMQEYSLSSDEGLALMCLAEALLRIPDIATRDELIRDKVAAGRWEAHLGRDRSLFVNAATWGLVLTGRLLQAPDEGVLGSALNAVVSRAGEPAIRAALDFAIRRLGTQFVRGQTIEEALANSAALEKRGFRYSYDMLGEAAMTAADAERYYQDYVEAIHAIGRAARGSGPIERNGISIKLSALHPRYQRAQMERVRGELIPRVLSLAVLARRFDIGLNIDAEEADRLEISLDVLEALCAAPELEAWDGIGFVVQAYGKRCPAVIDWLVDLGRRTRHRIMVRLVKGAYWDSEIKRAQVDGLADFPVYTRKVYTDIAYIACARKLLAAPDAVFPQFATHNARTLATVLELAGPDFQPEQYEFQCLHGMGEPLYGEVVGRAGLDRPCRIYAPVGTHETLLAYLVRRLLENGANSSFVNRIADEDVSPDELARDPAALASAINPRGAPNPQLKAPRDLFAPGRVNSTGVDLSDEPTLATLADQLRRHAGAGAAGAAPIVNGMEEEGAARAVHNPSDRQEHVGTVREPDAAMVEKALAAAHAGSATWAALAPHERAARLESAAELYEEEHSRFIHLLVREAGKSVGNAVAEVREAVDFLRFYAAEARRAGVAVPVGTVVCISPWNFPLAIFTGQVAAALAAGNAVIAKPAEETPLVAAMAVRLLLRAGVAPEALHFLPGDGRTGAALVADRRADGVMFTGSTEVARLIARTLSERTPAAGPPIPLIAETGGQNAMIVDSSALTEQVVADVLMSAFDSAGQRCSALRVLCLQEEIANRTLTMLKGALHELRVGNPDQLRTDVGPVISPEAKESIEHHVARMAAMGCKVTRADRSVENEHGIFVPPTIIEIERVGQLRNEVFGPVLHVVRYRREALDQMVQSINATGYGLTFGVHTRLDSMVERVRERVRAGNVYVNRNMVGAVVGVQPFGGHGLSGTGPKAGGPLYLRRLVRSPGRPLLCGQAPDRVLAYVDWLKARGFSAEARAVAELAQDTPLHAQQDLAGPVGEQNIYSVLPRGDVLVRPLTPLGLRVQCGALLATGNTGWLVEGRESLASTLEELPAAARQVIRTVARAGELPDISAALLEVDDDHPLDAVQGEIAKREGPLVVTQATSSAGLAAGTENYCPEWLVNELSTSINTTAAGGNARLMAEA
jgi:RHH-type proline utilization regulon transcriptional repressor/proline dehydrogenase/delta 1-pyrroline-5-carboxylate dehydrogenase